MEEQSSPEHLPPTDRQPVTPTSPSAVDVPHHQDAILDVAPESPFGVMLGQVLVNMLGGRLTDVHWFRTDWQRGGALTGYAKYRGDDDRDHDVVVKMPVPPRERNWLVYLQQWPDVAPTLHAHGDEVGGYDMVWVIMERLPHGPLGQAWDGQEFDLLIDAIGRFYEAAAHQPLHGEPRRMDWDALHVKARENVRHHPSHQKQRWNNALKRAQKKLPEWVQHWEDRPTDHWCHGDLHFGNAMTRTPPPRGPALLFDFALARPGCWLEDAIYLEHLFWAQRDRLGDRRITRDIAQERKRRGLHVEPDWADLANSKRALQAISVPAMLEHKGDAQTLQASLEVLEQQLGI
jgi:hypothetical protein